MEGDCAKGMAGRSLILMIIVIESDVESDG